MRPVCSKGSRVAEAKWRSLALASSPTSGQALAAATVSKPYLSSATWRQAWVRMTSSNFS